MTAEARIGPLRALRLAASWLTVAPVGSPSVPMDRRAGRAVIAVTPLIGAILGATAAGMAVALSLTRAPDLLIGVLVVAFLALATRGMHLDGLADTADGLGCYGDPQRVRQVMRDGSTGPFGAATLFVVMGLDGVCVAALFSTDEFYAIGFTIAASRLAAVVGCRWGLAAADSTGFGALVASSQRWSILAWLAVACAAASPLGIRGFIAVGVIGATSWAFTAHTARRTGGMNGDVLGAAIELSWVAALLTLVI